MHSGGNLIWLVAAAYHSDATSLASIATAWSASATLSIAATALISLRILCTVTNNITPAASKRAYARTVQVLVESAVVAVRDTTDSALLTNRLQWLAKDGAWSASVVLSAAVDVASAALKKFMDKKNEEQLKKMYKRLAKVGGLKVLSSSFKAYVQV